MGRKKYAEIQPSERAAFALLAIFPTPETVDDFSTEEGGVSRLRSFIKYAADTGVIKDAKEETFKRFVRENERTEEDFRLPESVTIENLFIQARDLLDLNVSIRGLTERINALIKNSGIDLPPVSNTMFSRLKREPVDTTRKRDTLRSLAFWMGHERWYLGAMWNYQTLVNLCRTETSNIHFKEGVRIGFSITSRGDIIGNEIVDWIRREIKEYISEGLDRFPFGNWGTVRSYDLTTLYVDFPMEADITNPASFQRSIRNAISVAHQIAIRWSLSAFFTPKRFLAIGIAAGDFSTMDNYLQPILNAKLPGDPVIRMTDYARQCVLINDIRAVFNQTPREVVLFNGETLFVWWVVGLWTLIYWDFVPQLIDDDILKNDEAAKAALARLLWFSDELTRDEIEAFHPNAVTSYLAHPHNTILGIEIAKTLYYRQRYWEANEILRIVNSVYPYNFNARSFRMVIFRCLAVVAPNYSEARMHFNRAEEEALYIQKNCQGLNEDYYDEYAVIKLTRALYILRLVRESLGICVLPEVCLDKDDVYRLLDESEALFEKGLTVSPTGIRSLYLITCVRILRRILKSDERYLNDPDLPMTYQLPDVLDPAVDLFKAMGWLRPEFDMETRHAILFMILEKSFQIHQDAVTLTAYRPTIYYCYAMVLWDFYPAKTYKIARRVHWLLNEAVAISESLKKDDICVYSYTRCHGEMMPAKDFIDHMNSLIHLVEKSVGGAEALFSRPDEAEIVAGEGPRPILFILNI